MMKFLPRTRAAFSKILPIRNNAVSTTTDALANKAKNKGAVAVKSQPMSSTSKPATDSSSSPSPSSSLTSKYPHLFPETDIFLGNNNEDAAAELTLLNHLKEKKQPGETKEGFRCLVVTGGADNFLSLLADPAVESVTCVDTNPIPNAIGQIKLALAQSELSKQEILTFLGTYDTPIQTMDREQVYRDVVKPNISPDAAELIEQKLWAEIQQGFNRFGAVVNADRHTRFLLEKEHDINMQDLFRGGDQQEELQQQVNAILNDKEFMEVDTYLEVSSLDVKLPPPVVAMFRQKLSSGYLQQCLNGLARIVGTQTHLARMALLQSYSDDCHPQWLDNDVRARLQQIKTDDKVQFVTGNVLALEPELSETKYDLISPSNIFDWMPTEKSAQEIQALCDKRLSRDGLFLFRRVFGERSVIADQCAATLQVATESDLSPTALANADMSPFFHQNVDGMACFRNQQ